MDEGGANSKKKASQWFPKKLSLAVAAALILSNATAAAWHRFRHPASRLPQKAKAAPEVKRLMHLDPFVVNLAEPDSDHFLRVGIHLLIVLLLFLQLSVHHWLLRGLAKSFEPRRVVLSPAGIPAAVTIQ